jgi:hypothetical protein
VFSAALAKRRGRPGDTVVTEGSVLLRAENARTYVELFPEREYVVPP